MSKIHSATHYLIIISVLFLGMASAHLCLDGNSDNKTEISFISDQSNHESPVNISFDCNQTSCHHHCNHLFDTNHNFVSAFSNLDLKILNNLDDNLLVSKYSSLPTKPPQA